MPRSAEPGASVSSRLLRILFSFRSDRAELSLAELTRLTELPHATVRRLALELVDVGALDRKSDGRFTVGLRLWQLGTLAPLSEPLRTTAQPFAEHAMVVGEHEADRHGFLSGWSGPPSGPILAQRKDRGSDRSPGWFRPAGPRSARPSLGRGPR